MYCRFCGAEIEKNVKICPFCGKDQTAFETSGDETEVIDPVQDKETEETKAAADEEAGSSENVAETVNAPEAEEKNGDGDDLDELSRKIMENVEDEWILDPAQQDAAFGQRDTLKFDERERQEFRRENRTKEKDPEEEEKYLQKVKRQKEESLETKFQKEHEKRKTIFYGCVFAAALLLFIVIAVGAYLETPTNRLKRAISGNHYETAGEIYTEDFAGKTRQSKGDELLEEAVEKILDDYQNDQVTAEKAEGYLNAIITFWSDSSAADALENIRLLEASKQAYEAALTYMDQEDYRNAIENFKLVNRKDSHYEDARSGIEEAQTKYENQCLDKANGFINQNSYDEAIAALDEGISYFGSNETLEQKRAEIVSEKEDYEVQTALKQAAAYVSEDNYYQALKVLSDGVSAYPDSAELKEQLDTYESDYQKEILTNAEKALGDNDDPNYDAAILVIDSALKTIGDEYPTITEALNEKRDEYSSEKENTPSATIVGTWKVSSVKVGFVPMLPSVYKIYSGKTGDLMQLEIYENGTYYLEILDENESGTWSGGKTNAYGATTFTLNNNSEMRELTMTNEGKLKLDFKGNEFTFEKSAS